jgi:hypothetical protein
MCFELVCWLFSLDMGRKEPYEHKYVANPALTERKKLGLAMGKKLRFAGNR